MRSERQELIDAIIDGGYAKFRHIQNLSSNPSDSESVESCAIAATQDSEKSLDAAIEGAVNEIAERLMQIKVAQGGEAWDFSTEVWLAGVYIQGFIDGVETIKEQIKLNSFPFPSPDEFVKSLIERMAERKASDG